MLLPTFKNTCLIKKDGTIAYYPSLKKKVLKTTIITSFYVNNIVYVFLSRKDIEEASKLIKPHFTHFGLTVHCDEKRNDGKSKTKAMYIPPPGKTATTTDDTLYLYEVFCYMCGTVQYCWVKYFNGDTECLSQKI